MLMPVPLRTPFINLKDFLNILISKEYTLLFCKHIVNYYTTFNSVARFQKFKTLLEFYVNISSWVIFVKLLLLLIVHAMWHWLIRLLTFSISCKVVPWLTSVPTIEWFEIRAVSAVEHQCSARICVCSYLCLAKLHFSNQGSEESEYDEQNL